MGAIGIGIGIGFGATLVLEVIVLYVVYRTGPEGRVDTLVRQRMRERGLRVRRFIWQEEERRTYEELRREGKI